MNDIATRTEAELAPLTVEPSRRSDSSRPSADPGSSV